MNERIPVWTQGDRLRKARQMTGMTTRQFALELGVSQGTVTSAENDNTKVRMITLKAWALATGVPIEWLQFGIDPTGDTDGGERARQDSNLRPRDYKAQGSVIPVQFERKTLAA